MASPNWQNLILISGHRRSGSTWLASVLGSADGVNLIPYEPLWLTHQPETPQANAVNNWWRSRGWYIPYDDDSVTDAEDAKVLVAHLEWLCRYYFDGPVHTLVIKEPHPNWLEFLVNAFRPKKVIYIRRHPLGIINSYDENGLYHKWGVEQEWLEFCQQLPRLLPQLVPLSSHAHHVVEKVAFMNHACDLLQERILTSIPHMVVEYETLCVEPQKEFARLYHWLGWTWDQKVWEKLVPLVDPDDTSIEEGFIEVGKRSIERANAWRVELAPHLVKRLRRFFARIGLETPFPGAGLTSLTREEKLTGLRRYISRRRAYLQQFGFRALVNSR